MCWVQQNGSKIDSPDASRGSQGGQGGPQRAGGDSRGAKMDPQVAQEGSREMHKGRGEFNIVLGTILSGQKGPKREPKGGQNGSPNQAKLEEKFCTNLDHDLDHSEEPKMKQSDVAEGVQKGRNSKMRVDGNSGKL